MTSCASQAQPVDRSTTIYISTEKQSADQKSDFDKLAQANSESRITNVTSTNVEKLQSETLFKRTDLDQRSDRSALLKPTQSEEPLLSPKLSAPSLIVTPDRSGNEITPGASGRSGAKTGIDVARHEKLSGVVTAVTDPHSSSAQSARPPVKPAPMSVERYLSGSRGIQVSPVKLLGVVTPSSAVSNDAPPSKAEK
jgi:hypothetical protein